MSPCCALACRTNSESTVLPPRTPNNIGPSRHQCEFIIAKCLLSGGWGAAGTELRSTLPLLVLYLVAAVAFCWLGVGSMRARRWARDLMLSLSWIWLVTGVCNFLLTLVLLPMLLETVTSDYPPEIVPFITAFVVVFTGVISVVLPGAFLLFFRSPHVAATCRDRGSRRQWTDGLPDRLLTFAIVWALMAVSVIVMPAYGWVFPFFGPPTSLPLGSPPARRAGSSLRPTDSNQPRGMSSP